MTFISRSNKLCATISSNCEGVVSLTSGEGALGDLGTHGRASSLGGHGRSQAGGEDTGGGHFD